MGWGAFQAQEVAPTRVWNMIGKGLSSGREEGRREERRTF
jgi:hypothetical protein